jgi:glycosyltransferase involved in cell wall biosynthesis
MAHWNRLRELQIYMRHHAPYVDRTIVIDGGSTDGSLEWLSSKEGQDLRIETHVSTWIDDPPGQRNKYIDLVKHTNTWALVLDVDELLEHPGIYSIRQIAAEAEKRNCYTVKFNAHDIQIQPDGTIWEHCSSYFNPNFFKTFPDQRYMGTTHVGLYGLRGGEGADRNGWDHRFRYFHIKTKMDEYYRGCRNYWTSAQVAQNVQNDPTWLSFKEICSKHSLQYFYQLAALMQAGTVPEDIANWFILNKDSDNSETRSFFVCYFHFMHPELNSGISNRDYNYDPNRQPIKGMKF